MQRTVSELVGGVRNGLCTRYHLPWNKQSVLSSVTRYVDGIRHGESVGYWDNGRVRSREIFDMDRLVQRQDFPKFDDPVPIVRLTAEANEQLYIAWQHMPVDEYPVVQNRDEVQALLEVPPFLREVHLRNQTGNVRSDYESWSLLNDAIAYFLRVDEAGQVIEASPNGSGVCPGASGTHTRQSFADCAFNPLASGDGPSSHGF
jgi:hypothetical protein